MITNVGWQTPLDTIRQNIAFNSAVSHLRHPSFRIVDALQHSPPAVQMDALFLTAVAMATVLGLDPHEMVARARRMIPQAEGPFTTHIQAAREYAKGELR